MTYRKVSFANDEVYHVFNRGVDKRKIFLDKFDLERFFLSMLMFNSIEPSGSIYEKSFELKLFQKQLGSEAPKLKKLINIYNSNSKNHLVEFVCYCLNPNHFHFVLVQKVDNGISEFMMRMGGYSTYFNKKYKRTGALFGDRFKAVYVSGNTQLLHLSAYVNLNNQLGTPGAKLSKSSWQEYLEQEKGICKKEIILEQFESKEKYKNFALSSLEDINRRKRVRKSFIGIDLLGTPGAKCG